MYISLSFVPSNDSISLDIQGREEFFLFLIYDAQKNLARGAQCVILSNLLCRLVIYTNEIITTQHCWNIYIYSVERKAEWGASSLQIAVTIVIDIIFNPYSAEYYSIGRYLLRVIAGIRKCTRTSYTLLRNFVKKIAGRV